MERPAVPQGFGLPNLVLSLRSGGRSAKSIRRISNARSEFRMKWGGMLRNAQVVSSATPCSRTMRRTAGFRGSLDRDEIECVASSLTKAGSKNATERKSGGEGKSGELR